LKDQLFECELRNQTLEKEKDKIQESKEQLEEKVRKMSSENFQLRKKIKEAEAKQTKLDSRNLDLQTKNEKSGEKLRRIRERAENEFTSLSSEVTRLEKQINSLKEEEKSDKRELSETKKIVSDLWEKVKAKNAEISRLRLSEERCILELSKMNKTSKASQIEKDQAGHFLSIKKTLKSVMDKDSTFCETEERSRDEILQDSEVFELVNSILLEFNESKENHITDVQKQISQMENYKKKLYKKAKAKLSELENELELSERKVNNLLLDIKSKDTAMVDLQKKDNQEIQTLKQTIEGLKGNQMSLLPDLKSKDKTIKDKTNEVSTIKKKYESMKTKQENMFHLFKELREKEGNAYLNNLSKLQDSLKERDALIAILQKCNFVLDDKITKKSTAHQDVVKKLEGKMERKDHAHARRMKKCTKNLTSITKKVKVLTF
jgi:hypothetical protein